MTRSITHRDNGSGGPRPDPEMGRPLAATAPAGFVKRTMPGVPRLPPRQRRRAWRVKLAASRRGWSVRRHRRCRLGSSGPAGRPKERCRARGGRSGSCRRAGHCETVPCLVGRQSEAGWPRRRPRRASQHPVRVLGQQQPLSSPVRAVAAGVYTYRASYILEGVAKHLIDLDEEALSKAQAELGTATIRDTVNLALERATSNRHIRVVAALDVLAGANLEDRSEAWR